VPSALPLIWSILSLAVKGGTVVLPSVYGRIGFASHDTSKKT